MGVSGCGKSTIASMLAHRLNWIFDSQFATLEEPRPDEHPIVVSIAPHPREIVEEIVKKLGKGVAPSGSRDRAIAGRRSVTKGSAKVEVSS
jgi:gluconate kinase